MIPLKQKAILAALGKYKFLTRKQIARLGIESYQSAMSKHFKLLLDADWIGLMDATTYGIGHVYYLKSKGALWQAKES